MKDIAPKMCITKVCHTLPGDLNIAKDPLSGNSTLKTPILAELNSALGIYNVGIYLSKEPETCDMSLLYDNVALYNTTMNLMSLHSYIQDVPGPSKQTSESFSSKCVTPVSTTVPLTYTALNDTTAVLMGALTCPNRYPESRHSFPDAPQKTGVWSLDSLATALVPMGGYPFICGGFSPMHPDHPSAEEQRPSFGLKPRNGKTNFASQTAAKSTSEQGNELGTVTLSQNLAMGDSQDRSAAETRKTSLRDLCWDLFKPDNTLLTFSPYTGHYLKSLVVFRGKECTPQALISYLSSMGEHPLIQQWRGRQPFRVHCHTYKHAENNLDMSVAWFGVHTGIAYTLKTLAQTIENLHSRRAYVASLGGKFSPGLPSLLISSRLTSLRCSVRRKRRRGLRQSHNIGRRISFSRIYYGPETIQLPISSKKPSKREVSVGMTVRFTPPLRTKFCCGNFR